MQEWTLFGHHTQCRAPEPYSVLPFIGSLNEHCVGQYCISDSNVVRLSEVDRPGHYGAVILNNDRTDNTKKAPRLVVRDMDSCQSTLPTFSNRVSNQKLILDSFQACQPGMLLSKLGKSCSCSFFVRQVHAANTTVRAGVTPAVTQIACAGELSCAVTALGCLLSLIERVTSPPSSGIEGRHLLNDDGLLSQLKGKVLFRIYRNTMKVSSHARPRLLACLGAASPRLF